MGDNIFTYNLTEAVKRFKKQNNGAAIFAVAHEDPQQYGVVELDGSRVMSIEEKPKNPKSNYIQTGVYMYDKKVFDYIRSLKPSNRGELEITDLNNKYLAEGELECEIIKDTWIDAGTSHEELLRANILASKLF